MAGISPMMVPLARRDATLEVLTYPVLFSTALFFNTTRPPFDDARVRRAVARAVDRALIVDVALAGFGTPSSSPVPADSPLAWSPDVVRDTAQRTRCSTPLAGGAVRAAYAATRRHDARRRAADRGQRRQRGRAAAAERSRRARDPASRAADRDGRVPHDRARRPKQFDMLIAGIPGDLSLVVRRRAVRHPPARRHARLHGLSHAGARHAPAAPHERPSGWRAASRGVGDGAARGRSLAPATWLYHSRGVQGVSRRVRGATMDLRGELVTVHDWSLTPRGAAE